MSMPADYILPDLKAVDRDSAIYEMLRHLIHIGVIQPQFEKSLFDALLQRESVLTTGIGFGLAFPHTSSEAVSKKITILGRSRTGIDFSSLDGKSAKEIYLMISPVTHETNTA